MEGLLLECPVEALDDTIGLRLGNKGEAGSVKNFPLFSP
jgi:hypothetical protein